MPDLSRILNATQPLTLAQVARGAQPLVMADLARASKGRAVFIAPDDAAMQRQLSRHPGYLEGVQAFIAADPLAARRAAVLDALDRAAVALR